MTVAIDMVGTYIGSGTRTYNLNFCKYINSKELKKNIYIFITKDYLKDLNTNTNPNIIYVIKSNIYTNIFIRILWMQLIFPFQLKRLNIKTLYSPMNIGPIMLRFFDIKFILALHSNLPWIYFSKMPGNYFRNIFTKYLMELSIFKCNKLIVDSEFAKKEIVETLRINKDKVNVIYLGVDEKYLLSENKNYLKDFDYKDYIISVLSCVKYHNIINLLKAFKMLKSEKKMNLRFILVLQILDKNYFNEIKKFIKENFEKNEIIFFHNLNNNYLANLYKKAKFYIFSSYCEVFGLTSLEAMSQGCPIIISDKSALPEINGEAAEYFNPDDIDQTKKSMEKLIYDTNHRDNLIVKGNIQFKKYNWKKTVNETLDILGI